jgi:hypothetical protein
MGRGDGRNGKSDGGFSPLKVFEQGSAVEFPGTCFDGDFAGRDDRDQALRGYV